MSYPLVHPARNRRLGRGPSATVLAALCAALLGAALPPAATAAAITKKVLVLNFDPLLPNHGNVRLHQYLGWNDPHVLMTQYIDDIYQATSGTVQYQVMEFQDLDVWPEKADGFTYTETSYLAAWPGGPFHSPDGVNYEKLISDYNLDARVQSGEIDEVIMYGFPYGGFFESQMVGDGAYPCNSPPIDHPGQKLYVIMGLNYERGPAEQLESFGHRAESIMTHVYGSWSSGSTILHLWDRFTRIECFAPGLASCGNVHYPPNGTSDYDYDNPGNVVSTADDWLYNYPVLNGQSRTFNSGEWFSDHRKYLMWWYFHMPRAAGQYADGHLNNWWVYLTDMNAMPESGGPQLPLPPANLQGSSGATQVDLTWDAGWGMTGYEVRRGMVSGGPYATIGATTALAWSDTTVAQSTWYYYVVHSTNANGSSGPSNEAAVLFVDAIAPTLAAWACVQTTQVVLRFSEALQAASAQDPAHYSLPGAAVQTAALDADGRSVVVTVTPLLPGAGYTLTVSGVQDLAGNPVAPGTTASFVCNPLDTVTFDAFSSASANAATLSWSHTVAGADRLLLVGVAIRGNVPVGGITYSGQALTRVRVDTAGVDVRSELWALTAPPLGTHTVEVTLTSPQNLVGGATSWTRVDQTTPLGAPAGAVHPGTAGTTAAVTIATSPGQRVVDTAATQNAGATLTAGPGQTQAWNRVGNAGVGAASSQPVSLFSAGMSWTLSMPEYWAVSAVPVNPMPLAIPPTASATPTATLTFTPTLFPSATHTAEATLTPTPTPSASPTPSATPTASPATGTPTLSPTVTASPTATATGSPTATATTTASPAPPTATPSPSATPTATPRAAGFAAVIAYPNPARGRVWFAFPEPQAQGVTVEVFNLLGERVAEIRVDRPQGQRVQWDLGQIAPGIYYYRLRVCGPDGRETVHGFRKLGIVR